MDELDQRLNDVFAAVRRQYFPRWASEWATRAASKASYTLESGFCDRANKVILVPPVIVAEGGPDLVATVIHEICHAVTHGGHGHRFCLRMSKAATRARALGQEEVAGILRREADQYASGSVDKVRAADTYWQVREAVANHGDSLGYAELCEVLAGRVGLTVEEFESRFRRLRRVYEREVRDQRREAEADAKFAARLMRE